MASPRNSALDLKAFHLKQRFSQIFPNARLVIYDQNFFFRAHLILLLPELPTSYLWSIGDKNAKVLPILGSLSTQISPRCAWINRFAMASPSPIPDVFRSPHETLEYFLMMFRCDERRVGHAHFHTVRPRQTKSSSSSTGATSATRRSQKWARSHRYCPARRMFQRVIQQVCRRLLHFLVETERWK